MRYVKCKIVEYPQIVVRPKVPGNESSRERKLQGTKVPPMELSFLGTKVPWYESSIIRFRSPIWKYNYRKQSRKKSCTNPWFKSFSVLSSQILTCKALPSRTRLNMSSITQRKDHNVFQHQERIFGPSISKVV